MQITNEQRVALGYAPFVERFRVLLLECFPQASVSLDHKEFGSIAVEQAKVARSYGLRSESAVATFLLSAWLLGVDFDRRIPAIHEQLTSALHESDKAEWLEAFVVALLGRLSA
jgi:hypothetical protein